MKKGILLTILLVAVVLVSGCGKKSSKLVCTQTASGVDITFNIDFDGNVVKNMDFSYDMDLSSYSDTQINAIGKQDFCTRVKSLMSTFKDAFKDCNQDISNKHLNVKSVLDVNKLSDSALNISSPDKAKEELEKIGYSCTIK